MTSEGLNTDSLIVCCFCPLGATNVQFRSREITRPVVPCYVVWWMILALPQCMFGFGDFLFPYEVPYGVAPEPWADQLGSQRARIWVNQTQDAIRVHIPWRRHDAHPERKATLIFEAATGRATENVVRWNVNSSSATLCFKPLAAVNMTLTTSPSTRVRKTANRVVTEDKAKYIAPKSSADPACVERHHSGAA